MSDGIKSKIFIIIAIIIFLALLGGMVSVASRNSALDRELAGTKKLAKKLESDITAISKEKENLAQEKEKLQSDATSYIAINTRVSQEKEKLQEALVSAKKNLETKETNLERLKVSLRKLEKETASKKGTAEGDKLEKEVKELKSKIAELNKKSAADKATFYYNLGVAYTQARYYDDAVDSYEKSLKLDDSNAEAHYNLALIYNSIREEPDKAAEHYRAYLKLKPNAPDREEVEALLNK